MATAQSTQSKSAKSRSNARNTRESDTEELSGERDEHYNLISVLYHGLQGADQCVLYAEDADDAGDDELAEFLRNWGRQQAQAAQQAKQLLLQRMGGEGKRAGGQAGRSGGRSQKARADADDGVYDDDED
jgi:hypothetical protein